MDDILLDYSNTDFISSDPIQIPHLFSRQQDIEISGFIAATFSWGQRVTIINKSREFLNLMDNDPHNFVLGFSEEDLDPFKGFKHRTFNGIDALAFLRFFRCLYQDHDTMEDLLGKNAQDTRSSIIQIVDAFKNMASPEVRTMKHIQDPRKGSACKRINMFLRWMVRQDPDGIDFGVWTKLKPRDLICPLDIHVANAAYELGLLENRKSNWKNAERLTNLLLELDPHDPVKYDLALFYTGQYLKGPKVA